jgi:hypothetical protein
MKTRRSFVTAFSLLPAALLLLVSHFPTRVAAFSLLGPYEDWMDVTNGFRQTGDIGGPMDISEGYRWNVPVLTYGFDQSFLDYFGSNGVVAVEAAIGILNGLPPASGLVLSSFTNYSQQINNQAATQNLIDLKSEVLFVLLEHMGLAQPTRYVFCVRQWDPSLEPYAYADAGLPGATGIIGRFVLERNFDPVTLTSTIAVNGAPYSAFIMYGAFDTNGIPSLARAVEFPIDPLDYSFTTVADNSGEIPSSIPSISELGMFYTGLTYDDVGGIRFLLSTNNLSVEPLLPTVRPATTNTTLVNVALRPGVDKITFVRHPTDPSTGVFQSTNVEFTDTFVTNGQLLHQRLERTIAQPDFVFYAGDAGRDNAQTPVFSRTGTSNWINDAEINHRTNQAGPGVIVTPTEILIHQLGPSVISSEPNPEKNVFISANQWGFFDGSTNRPITFPGFSQGIAHPLKLRLRLYPNNSSGIPLLSHTWQQSVPIGGIVSLLTSTNLSDWVQVTNLTNNGAVVEWLHFGISQGSRYFRVVQEP